MKHAIKIVVAMLGLAAAVPAQLRIEGRLGHRVSVRADVHGPRSDHHRRHVPAPRPRPVVTVGDCRTPIHCEPIVRGHWETVCEQVWVPPSCREEYVPARYGWVRDPCGNRHWGVVEPAHTRTIHVPGHFENRTRRVWVPGC